MIQSQKFCSMSQEKFKTRVRRDARETDAESRACDRRRTVRRPRRPPLPARRAGTRRSPPARGDAPDVRARDRRPSSVSRVNAKRVNPARPSPRRRDPAIRSEHYRAPRVEATKNNNYPGQLCRRVSRDVIQIHGTAYQHRSPQQTSKRSPHDTLDSTQASPL